jgi:hypothetical protein
VFIFIYKLKYLLYINTRGLKKGDIVMSGVHEKPKTPGEGDITSQPLSPAVKKPTDLTAARGRRISSDAGTGAGVKEVATRVMSGAGTAAAASGASPAATKSASALDEIKPYTDASSTKQQGRRLIQVGYQVLIKDKNKPVPEEIAIKYLKYICNEDFNALTELYTQLKAGKFEQFDLANLDSDKVGAIAKSVNMKLGLGERIALTAAPSKTINEKAREELPKLLENLCKAADLEKLLKP